MSSNHRSNHFCSLIFSRTNFWKHSEGGHFHCVRSTWEHWPGTVCWPEPAAISENVVLELWWAWTQTTWTWWGSAEGSDRSHCLMFTNTRRVRAHVFPHHVTDVWNSCRHNSWFGYHGNHLTAASFERLRQQRIGRHDHIITLQGHTHSADFTWNNIHSLFQWNSRSMTKTGSALCRWRWHTFICTYICNKYPECTS